MRGVVAGNRVVDFKVECFDGSYHNVDSSEQSFKMAGIQAFRTVAAACKPVILEPIHEVEAQHTTHNTQHMFSFFVFENLTNFCVTSS